MKQYIIIISKVIVGAYCFISGVVFYGDYIHPHVKALIMPDTVQIMKIQVEK